MARCFIIWQNFRQNFNNRIFFSSEILKKKTKSTEFLTILLTWRVKDNFSETIQLFEVFFQNSKRRTAVHHLHNFYRMFLEESHRQVSRGRYKFENDRLPLTGRGSVVTLFSGLFRSFLDFSPSFSLYLFDDIAVPRYA